MQAAFYVKQGAAHEVLQVGEQPAPEPGPGEVRVHLKTSGVNPSDWKSRSGRTAPMSAPLIIPHSDGAGDVDRVGPGVTNRVGQRVWVWNGQWRRPHGTAAEYRKRGRETLRSRFREFHWVLFALIRGMPVPVLDCDGHFTPRKNCNFDHGRPFGHAQGCRFRAKAVTTASK